MVRATLVEMGRIVQNSPVSLISIILIVAGWFLATTRFSKRQIQYVIATLGVSMITVGVASLI